MIQYLPCQFCTIQVYEMQRKPPIESVKKNPQNRKTKEEQKEACTVKKGSPWTRTTQSKQKIIRSPEEKLHQTIGGLFAEYIKKILTAEEKIKFLVSQAI